MDILNIGISKRCAVLLAGTIFLFAGCGKKALEQKQSQKNIVEGKVEYELIPDSAFYQQSDSDVVMDKPQLAAYYRTPEMREFYGKRILPPKFDYNMDLSNKTYIELRLLRNEIFARNGYLFNDATLRAYFNQFAWYPPIFDVPTFKVYLNEREKKFVDKIAEFENAKLAGTYTTIGDYKMVNLDHVVNLTQFQNINDSLMQSLREKNFALASADNEQIFYVYDKNQYGYIPNFITTDLYLQLLHKYLSSLMRGIEKQKMVPAVTDLMQRLYNKSRRALTATDMPQKKVALWANTYLAIALSLLRGEYVSVEPQMHSEFLEEIRKVTEASGYGSTFLDRTVFYYSQFKPRGNYTEDDTLKKYFRCIKWLNSAPMNVDDDGSFQSSLLVAYWIRNDKICRQEFNLLNRVIGSLAGEEDNYSISHLIELLDDNGSNSIAQLLSSQNIAKLKNQLKVLNVDRILPKAANNIAKEDFSKKFILFTAARYTFDADILIRLVNVTRPEISRPFPKGLDIFAALGNKRAENILLNNYRENQRWPAYTDSLTTLKVKFENYKNWGATIYDKTMDCINSLNLEAANYYPLFMQTEYWQKKNLNTSLAAWTELKHDMILYTEQPYAAEAGEGGGPPPPMHLSYVEPNVVFWNKTIELLDLQQNLFLTLGLATTESEEINSELKEVAKFLLAVSKKELNKEIITEKEFSEMSWLGGRIEGLTFRILGTDHLPERERQIALAADVYAFNDSLLEEAVGKADEIYVIAEINGLPYLTKGSCFSYYEFKSVQRLTDEDWQRMLAEGKTPRRPDWLNDIYVKTSSLTAKPEYNYEGFVSHGYQHNDTP